MRGPSQVGGIGAAGVGDQDAVEGTQNVEELVLLGFEQRGVEGLVGTETQQRRHASMIYFFAM